MLLLDSYHILTPYFLEGFLLHIFFMIFLSSFHLLSLRIHFIFSPITLLRPPYLQIQNPPFGHTYFFVSGFLLVYCLDFLRSMYYLSYLIHGPVLSSLSLQYQYRSWYLRTFILEVCRLPRARHHSPRSAPLRKIVHYLGMMKV